MIEQTAVTELKQLIADTIHETIPNANQKLNVSNLANEIGDAIVARTFAGEATA